MNAKKKILSLGLAASLAAVAVVGSSLAYFTDKDEKDNTYSIGNVDIQLVEPNWGTEEADNLYPGEPVAKDPTVVNAGKNPAFVRVSVEGMDNFSYRTDYQENKLGDGWVYNESDGYFYYTKVLESDKATDALFDQIVLNKDVENGNGEVGHIIVKAEAIQAQGAAVQWSRVQTMSVEEIANWFETQEQIPYDPEF